jgi:hypothetical protein
MATQPIASAQQGMKFTLTTTCDAPRAQRGASREFNYPPFSKSSPYYPVLIPLEFLSPKCYCSPRQPVGKDDDNLYSGFHIVGVVRFRILECGLRIADYWFLSF